MRGIFVSLALAGLALAGCSRPAEETPPPPAPAAEAPQAQSDPASVIRPLYERYRTDPAVTTFPSLEESAPWSDSLKTLLVAMMARSEARQEPILDFDPIIGAQDYQLSDLNVVNEAVSEGSHSVVRATFKNAGTTTEIIYDLIWEDDRWKVDNIRGEGWDLRQIAAAPNADAIPQQ